MNIHPGILVKRELDRYVEQSRHSLETLRLQTGFNKELFYGILSGQKDLTVNRVRKLIATVPDTDMTIEALMVLQREYEGSKS